MHRLREWEPEQLMFVDESAANERTMDRKWGWAPKGRAARVISPLQRSKKWSILPLYTMDGFIAYEIIHDSYTTELFMNFLRNKVLPLCSPFPGPRSVLIMDNAKIHCHPVDYPLNLAHIEHQSPVRRRWHSARISPPIFARPESD